MVYEGLYSSLKVWKEEFTIQNLLESKVNRKISHYAMVRKLEESEKSEKRLWKVSMVRIWKRN